MARRVRHIRAGRNEHIVVHRDRGGDSGCLWIIVLILILMAAGC